MIWRRRKARKTYGTRSLLPFRSEVVDPRRRSRQRRIWFKAVLAGALAVALGYGAAEGFRRVSVAPLFEIKKVEITGLERLSPADLEPLIGIRPSETLPELDLGAVHGRLLQHPWIRDAQVRKTYPDLLQVRVVERRPFAVVESESGDVLVDDTGKILGKAPSPPEDGESADVHPSPAKTTWPRFRGLGKLSAGGIGFEGRPAFRRAVRAVAVLNRDPAGSDAALSVDVADRKELVVRWEGIRLRFGPDRIREGWEQYQTVRKDIQERRSKIREIDLRFPDTVIVR